MKSRIILIALALMLLTALPALGESVAHPEIPQIGSEACGFTVADVYELEGSGETCVLMEHQKSGAQLIYVPTNNTNRAFVVSYRTPAKDDRGIPHVFEHATMCGSEKYPDPNLFFSMIAQTYNTFLNAMTATTSTSYISGSLSEEQLYAFVDFTLAGLSHPLIMTDERSMMREAYRYELADKSADITLTGTVYSETLGALSLPAWHGFNVSKTMSPGSRLANVFGGDPDVIPGITHQELIDFHNDYYHPSNALMVLYGSVDYERFLKLIDEAYLSEYEARDIVLTDEGYEPWEGYREVVYACPVAEGDTSTPVISYCVSLGGMTDEEFWISSKLIDVMNKNDPRLKRLCEERLPGRSVTVSIRRDCFAEPTLVFEMTGGRDGDQATLKGIADDVIAELITNGVEPTTLREYCEGIKLTQALTTSDVPGITLASAITDAWARTGDVNQYRLADRIESRLQDYSDGVEFGAILRKYLTDPACSALITTLPERGAQEAKNEELKRRLADMKAGMTDAELDALVARTADFVQWTKQNAESSLIDRVKVVDVDTLPVELVAYSAQTQHIEGICFVSSNIGKSDAVNITIRLDASTIPPELLHAYSLRAQLVGKTPTKTRTLEQVNSLKSNLAAQLMLQTGNVQYADGSFHPTLIVTWCCMKDRVEESIAFVKDMLLDPDFSELNYIRSYALEANDDFSSIIAVMPSIIENKVIDLLTCNNAWYGELLSDMEGRFMASVAAMSDEELAAMVADMEAVWDYVATREGLIVSAVGDDEGIRAVREYMGSLTQELGSTHFEPVDYSPYYGKITAPVAVLLAGAVQYNSLVLPIKELGYEMNGKFKAMQALVSDKILMPLLRFQNSAYGAGCQITEKWIRVSSFRDPGFATTYDVYKDMGRLVREMKLTQEDLDGYIISAFSNYAKPVSPMSGGTQAVNDAISGEDTFADTLRYMEEIKQFSLEDVEAYAVLFDKLAADGLVLTLATEQTVNENKDMFGTIIDMRK